MGGGVAANVTTDYWGWGAEDDDFALRLVNHLHGGGWSEALRRVDVLHVAAVYVQPNTAVFSSYPTNAQQNLNSNVSLIHKLSTRDFWCLEHAGRY